MWTRALLLSYLYLHFWIYFGARQGRNWLHLSFYFPNSDNWILQNIWRLWLTVGVDQRGTDI